MSGRRSSKVEGMVSRNREIRHSKLIDRLDRETGRRHIEEDGDRLFRHLALALDLGLFRLRAEQQRFDAGDVERRRDLAGELGLDEVERLFVEVDRLGIDRRPARRSRAA